MAYNPQPILIWDTQAIEACKRLKNYGKSMGNRTRGVLLKSSCDSDAGPFLLHIMFHIPHRQLPIPNNNPGSVVFEFNSDVYWNEIAHWHHFIETGVIKEGLTSPTKDDSVKWLSLLGVPSA